MTGQVGVGGRRPTPKPSLDAKLQAWGKAFHAVSDEMGQTIKQHGVAATSADVGVGAVVAAAHVAAQLVAGTDLDG